jgi:hypothetical protein
MYSILHIKMAAFFRGNFRRNAKIYWRFEDAFGGELGLMSLFDNNSKVENLLTVSLSENINTYIPGTRLYSIIILQYRVCSNSVQSNFSGLLPEPR